MQKVAWRKIQNTRNRVGENYWSSYLFGINIKLWISFIPQKGNIHLTCS